MAECGICLEDLETPVCIPCGHVHCEECIRAHINSGNDALKSSCPSCRSVFHIAMPDLSFVPEKYHDFMVPSVRKLYMDIPSTSLLTAEIEQLKKRVATLSRDRDALMEKCEGYMAASRRYADQERDARMQACAAEDDKSQVQKKYEDLKKKYATHLDQCLSQTSPDGRKRKSRGSAENSRVSLYSEMKLEEPPYASQAPTRPKRALPRSSLTSTSQLEESHDPLPRFVKRQRYSDVGPASQTRLSEQCECCKGSPETYDR
ncbi:hypothetical protein K503DRAFT_715031 [Rhizopogon vinicolor AM-OR11-026]|uniref:RING-type domain-containing protein n=1 Tax=Rhizopogon vinicolor AM-OR11-026 TaxID=1314800 RepID=A0A1B7N5M8_9AGAM|nr:hypothetical protein K503DRAFT_715031 [Rhizopogon vinicolor AM-OR11-026]